VALDHAALCELDLDPGFLDLISVLDGDPGIFERELPDLGARLFGPIEAPGTATDFFS
jgi:hypothetical protein